MAGLSRGRTGRSTGRRTRAARRAYGTVFKVNTDGTGFVTLVNFGRGDGTVPVRRPRTGSDGALYGTTAPGGTSDSGTVFKVNTDGTGFVTLVNFGSGAATGRNPQAGLVQGSDGTLYGTTFSGGASGLRDGVQGEHGRDGVRDAGETSARARRRDGTRMPASSRASDGALYGTTYAGRRRRAPGRCSR